ncbi:MAG: hypothetical protein AAF585_00845 [Verrucomicrobiota bacterium]
MEINSVESAPGHWLFAKLGKRGLRPGGLELSNLLMEKIAIGPDDGVVEFAPGLGVTAKLAWKRNPRSWTGVELDETAAEKLR